MRLPKQSIVFLLAILVVITCSSWGYLVHKTTMQLAVYKLPKAIQPFFYKNMDYLVENAGRPDKRRNTDSTEAPKHFIDLEKFGENAAYKMPYAWNDAVSKYSMDTLKTYGYVPYEILFMQQQLTAAFKAGNADSILFYATDLGHYIGDANVPLHSTENYDGQLTDQVGIHSLWESMIPEIEIGNYNLYDRHKASYLSKPAERIWKAIRKANALVPEMLATEKTVTLQFPPDKKYRTQMRRGKEVKYYTSDFAKAYSKALGNTINEQLLCTSDMIADFWYTAWVDAGKPALDITLSENEAAANQLEQGMYKKNQLIENNLLRSKKEVAKKED